MGLITAITAQKNKDRVNLFVDGEFAFGLSRFALLSAGLKIGQEIDSDRLQQIVQKSEFDSAQQKALKYLSLKPVTTKKMREYLLGKGFGEDAAEAAVSRLVELKLLDDEYYAKLYVDSYRNKQGNSLMRYKLRGLGITDEIVMGSLTDESEAARIAAEKYLRTHKKDRQKLYTYLFNKGFGSEAVKNAVALVDFSNSGTCDEGESGGNDNSNYNDFDF